MIISRSILLRMRKFLDKFIEKIKTHISCSINFLSENRDIYEIMWKNFVQPDRPQMTK
jgi:hypothetical protein